jgi:transcriptional regulator GlxA family with amidase domain
VLPLSRPHDDDSMRSAEASIERNFKRPLRVEDLARERHMSARNFIRRFRTATGRTPGDYLQATRIAVAKQLLEDGARSVQSVGLAVGYEDAAFFRALFRRHTGMSPAEYRQHFGATGITTRRGRLQGATTIPRKRESAVARRRLGPRAQ